MQAGAKHKRGAQAVRPPPLPDQRQREDGMLKPFPGSFGPLRAQVPLFAVEKHEGVPRGAQKRQILPVQFSRGSGMVAQPVQGICGQPGQGQPGKQGDPKPRPCMAAPGFLIHRGHVHRRWVGAATDENTPRKRHQGKKGQRADVRGAAMEAGDVSSVSQSLTNNLYGHNIADSRWGAQAV